MTELEIMRHDLSVRKFWLKLRLFILLSATASNNSVRQSSVNLFFTNLRIFNFFDFFIKGHRLKILPSPTSAPVRSIVYALSFFKSSMIPRYF